MAVGYLIPAGQPPAAAGAPLVKEERLVRSTTGAGGRPARSGRPASAAQGRRWLAGIATAALTASGLAFAAAAPAGAAAKPTKLAQAAKPARAAQTAHAAGAAKAAHAAGAAASAKVGARSPDRAARDYRRACALVTEPGWMSCMALVRTAAPHGIPAARGAEARRGHGASPAGDGYGPDSLQSAYKLPSSTAGSGQTVAVVDAFNDPHAAADLAAYRSAWGLPACGKGCFTKVNQDGQASPLPRAAGSTGWATEESLDIEMVSAICPNCHILLVEADNARAASLGKAVNTAVSMGAKYVSNSYGGPESASDASLDSKYYRHPGVAVTASAGDSGYGTSYPAASRYVTSVGGTSLRPSAGARGWKETAWGSTGRGAGTGSGCSADSTKPSWQADAGCAKRTENDVAADADPNTGVAVYDSYDQHGWLEVGGTSAASPVIASVFALAGTPAAGSYPSSYPYAHASGLFDVTSGADGSCAGSYLCTAAAGFDGPTGLGTPDGTAAFASNTPAAGCTPAQLLRNRGFERRTIRPWAAGQHVLTKAASGVPAHSGSRLAWLDGYGITHTDTLAQTVTIPAGCTHATFSFWLETDADDTSGPAADTLTLRVLDASGAVLQTLARYSNKGAATGYRRHSFSLASYAGQQITLKFTGKETVVGHVTSFFEDDNALRVS
jgi:hypothetical protein